jgi:hypothetical protein
MKFYKTCLTHIRKRNSKMVLIPIQLVLFLSIVQSALSCLTWTLPFASLPSFAYRTHPRQHMIVERFRISFVGAMNLHRMAMKGKLVCRRISCLTNKEGILSTWTEFRSFYAMCSVICGSVLNLNQMCVSCRSRWFLMIVLLAQCEHVSV